MLGRIKRIVDSSTLSQRFMLAGLLILLVGMLGIGVWVQEQIITGVVHRSGATTALYVDSFIAPLLQELAHSETLPPAAEANLKQLLPNTPLGRQIVDLRIWSTRGKLLFTTDQSYAVGKTYPMREGLLHARLGDVYSSISDLDQEENLALSAEYTQLLETYSPVWSNNADEVVAVAEFYERTDDLNREIALLKQRSWIVVGVTILVMYMLLAGFVRRASDTITRQKIDLAEKVNQLTKLLSLNLKLQGNIKRASASVVLLNEGYLRRIGSELHDGPAQDLGLSILKLDAVLAQMEKCAHSDKYHEIIADLTAIQASMQNALKEMRGIAAGLSLPQLMELNLTETVTRITLAHERRTGTRVTLALSAVPEDVALPIKVTVYRLIQEALNNAYRHAGGVGQRVSLSCTDGRLLIEVADSGVGFDPKIINWSDGHLGINGIRERVESLGGDFHLETAPQKGTLIRVHLPVQVEEAKAL